MISEETEEMIKETFKSPLTTSYQEILENKMKGSNFVFDYVDGLSYLYHKISLDCSESYKDSPNWIKTKKQK